MVRWAQARWLLAVLGLGGLAMAQEGLIVDPWRHPSAPGLGQAMRLETKSQRSSPRASTDAARAAGPSVVPVGPPLVGRTNQAAVVPLGPVGHDDVVDPWVSTRARAVEAEHRARLAPGSRDWAWEVREIVDPWATGPLAVTTDPIIVDPWAR